MRTHELKTWPSFFEAVLSGAKTFEVRLNDRDFAVGDKLVLLEWDPGKATVWSMTLAFTGRKIEKRVTYVLPGGKWGIAEAYCVLGLGDAAPDSAKVKELAEAAERCAGQLERIGDLSKDGPFVAAVWKALKAVRGD